VKEKDEKGRMLACLPDVCVCGREMRWGLSERVPCFDEKGMHCVVGNFVPFLLQDMLCFLNHFRFTVLRPGEFFPPSNSLFTLTRLLSLNALRMENFIQKVSPPNPLKGIFPPSSMGNSCEEERNEPLLHPLQLPLFPAYDCQRRM